MTLISIVGGLGWGKNAVAVAKAFEQQKRPIYSNFSIMHPNYHPLTVVDLLKLPSDCDVFIDEAYRWFEARVSSWDYINLLMSYVIFELRKRLMDVYMLVQMFSSLDIRLREMSDIIIWMRPRDRYKKDDFRFAIETKFPYSWEENMIRYEDMEVLFPYYNTYETPPIRKAQEIEYMLLQEEESQKAYLNKVFEIIDTIKPQMEKITHDSVRATLKFNEIYSGYSTDVYLFMKEIINNKNLQVAIAS